MANSKLDICNRALQKVGEKKLSNLTGTDANTTAVTRAYVDALEYELRTHNWNFAIRRHLLIKQTITIVSITAANPPVVTYTATGTNQSAPEEGDRVLFSSLTEMTQLNNNTYRVNNLNKSAGTFEIVDQDTDANIDGSAYTAETTGAVSATIQPHHGWRFKFRLPNIDSTITAVTKANPGVVTYTGIDPQNDDVIYIRNVGGMTELNNNRYKIGGLNTSAKTFNLLDPDEGTNVNTSSYTTYTSGGTAHNMSYLRLISADGYSGIHDNLGGLGKNTDFTVERGYFLCNNDDPLKIRYISYETDVTKWDSMFKEAIAARIAADITTELDQDQKDKASLIQEYMMIIKHAKMADAIETPAEVMPESDWNLARY